MYIDTHAHLTDGAFDHDRQELIKGLAAGGIGKIIEISCDPKDFPVSAALAEKNPGIYLAFGIHPEFAESCTESDMAALEKYLRHPKCVALGEIGLDYHYEGYDKALQAEVFERQLILAQKLDMPVIIHSRDACEDTMALLRKYRPRGVMHCFSYSPEIAREVVRLGMYVGFTGVLTFRNSKKAWASCAEVPMDRLLLETDSPYMAPVPHRGEKSHSGMIKYTAAKMAEIKGVSAEEMTGTCRENGERLFGL